MNIQLSEHFTYSKLLKFTLPSMVMMVFTSIYGVVDGVFVSNYVGSESFAAVNLIMPFLMILGAVGFMLGSGGSALVSYTLGTGDSKRANEIFSLLIYVLIGLGAVFTVGGILFLAPMSRFLGADETMLPICVSYGRIVLSAMIPFMLQSGALRHRGRRCCQHGTGHTVHRRFQVGRHRRRAGHRYQSVDRRRGPPAVFRPSQ